MQTPVKERQRASRLRRRAEWAAANFYGNTLVQMYREIGVDIEETTVLPWIPLLRMYQEAGQPVPVREFIEALEGSPYFELDRRPSTPIVRFRFKPKTKERS